MLHAVAPHVPRGDTRMLGILMGDLDKFLAPFLVELGQRNAQIRTIDDRIEAQIRLPYGTIDRLDHRLVPHADGNHARLGHADRGDLINRHGGAVGIDMDGIKEVGRSTPGTQRAEIVLEGAHRAVHPPLQILEINSVAHLPLPDPSYYSAAAGSSRTTVQWPSPLKLAPRPPFS